MDKLTAIKIKYDDGTYSDQIPISVLAENVEWNNTYSLVEVLGSIAFDTKGSVQDQLTQLFNQKVDSTDLSNYVNSTLKSEVTSWLSTYISPAGGTIAYDASLSIEGAAADAKAAGQIVQISTTKPTKENNRIWVGASEEEYEVPTMEDLNNVSEQLEQDEVGLTDGTFFKKYAVGNLYIFAEDKVENAYYQNQNGTLITTTSANMRCFILKVIPNNDYICTSATFVVLLDGDKKPITQQQIDYRYQSQFNVSNAEYIALSYNNTYAESTYAICKGTVLSQETKYKLPYLYEDPITGVDNRPKALINNVVVRLDDSNMDDGGNYIVFTDVCHQYDHSNKITGNVYALETALPNRTNQRIFKSFDGGETWELVTTLACDFNNGVKWTNIFVTAKSQTFVLLRENDVTSHDVVTYSLSDFTNPIGTLNIGSKYWHDSTHNIDYSFRNSTEFIMFAEYGKNTENEYNVWRSTDLGASWTKVKTDIADAGTPGSGDIKHYHTCQYLEDTNEWLLSSGDADSQCKFWTSNDNGTTWTLRGSGSQDYRFLGVCYDSNYLYWGTDAPTTAVPTKLIKCNRNNYNIQTIVQIPHNNAIYGITKINMPNGILMVPQHEPLSAATNGITKVVFYSFDKDILYNVADIPNIGVSDADYIGFETASRMQDIVSGSVFGVMTANLAYANVSNKSRYHASKICKIKLSMLS